MEKAKEDLLRRELDGLDVEWGSHMSNGSINMAKVNGHSIIWHKHAYTVNTEPTVEVYFIGADQTEGHVPIKGLRDLVE